MEKETEQKAEVKKPIEESSAKGGNLKGLIAKKGDYSIHVLIEDLIHLSEIKEA